MRLFVALDLPDALRQSLAAWRPDLPDARWTPAERLHLTLRFLGNVSGDVRFAITEHLSTVESPPVPVEVGGHVWLPSARRPRVLAARVAGVPELEALHGRVEAALAVAGVAPEDRPLLPHVTLARFRTPDSAELRRALRDAEPPAVRGVAASFSLVDSQRDDGGPHYATLLRVPL